MKLFGIGIGQAGGNILDACVKTMRKTGKPFMPSYLAINTSEGDLKSLEHIEEENKLGIGGTVLKIPGGGTGVDNVWGYKVMKEEVNNVLREIDYRFHQDIHGFFLIAALGGGTGSGGAPLLAHELKKRYPEKPLYGFGILPSEGKLFSKNAITSLKTFEEEVDNLFLFDNKHYGVSETMGESIKEWNEKIASRFVNLFGAGEIPKEELEKRKVKWTKTPDPSEIVNTLDCGGISTIGHASKIIRRPSLSKSLSKSLLGLFGLSKSKKTKKWDKEKLLTHLLRKSIGNLTIPCDVKTAEKAYLLFYGHPRYLSEEGRLAAMNEVENLIAGEEVRYADYQYEKASKVSVLTLFSGVDIPKVREMKEKAEEYIRGQEKEREEKEIKKILEDVERLF